MAELESFAEPRWELGVHSEPGPRTVQWRSFGHGTAGSKRTMDVVTHHVRPGSGAAAPSRPAHAQSSGCTPPTAALPPPWKFEPSAMTCRGSGCQLDRHWCKRARGVGGC